MDGLDISVFDNAAEEDAVYLICTSTYGQGDVPDNARALYDSLDSQPKFLGHVRYGVIALGDRTYQQTFCLRRQEVRRTPAGPGRPAHRRGLDATTPARHPARNRRHRVVPAVAGAGAGQHATAPRPRPEFQAKQASSPCAAGAGSYKKESIRRPR